MFYIFVNDEKYQFRTGWNGKSVILFLLNKNTKQYMSMLYIVKEILGIC